MKHTPKPIWICTSCNIVYVNETLEYNPHAPKCAFGADPIPVVTLSEYQNLEGTSYELLEAAKRILKTEDFDIETQHPDCKCSFCCLFKAIVKAELTAGEDNREAQEKEPIF